MIKNAHFDYCNIDIWARLLKGLIAYPVDNYDLTNMISPLFIDYISNILHLKTLYLNEL